jgi:hypothetical protein
MLRQMRWGIGVWGAVSVVGLFGLAGHWLSIEVFQWRGELVALWLCVGFLLGAGASLNEALDIRASHEPQSFQPGLGSVLAIWIHAGAGVAQVFFVMIASMLLLAFLAALPLFLALVVQALGLAG